MIKPLPYTSTIIPDTAQTEYECRFGTPVEKGIYLNEVKARAIEDEIKKKMVVWSAYPDIWADECLVPTGSSFEWKFYQRVMLRTIARIPLNHITGARGVSKTFCILFGFFHRAVFAPGSQLAFAAPSKTQSAQVGKQTVNDILNRFPILRNELDGDVVGGKDYFEPTFTFHGFRYAEIAWEGNTKITDIKGLALWWYSALSPFFEKRSNYDLA